MKYIIDTGIFFVLLLLIGVRFFAPDANWMSYIQYIGLGVAYSDFMYNVICLKKESRKFGRVLAILVFGFLICLMVAVLGIVELVPFLVKQKALDIATLLTLSISLPQGLYFKLLEEKEIKNE